MTSAPKLTPKAAQTRAHILTTALDLFARQGYEQTTMRDIATAAECSLGLTYRYFARKESLVLALYAQLEHEFVTQVARLPPGPLAARFTAALHAHLANLAPYRSVLRALFGAALDPSGAGVLGTDAAGVRATVQEAFGVVVAGATDAPPPPLAAACATVLYGLHLALVFVWLADRDPTGAGAAEMIDLIGTGLGVAGPLLMLPGADATLARLAAITGRVLG
jgi:AcrR family transcriptional regulator